MKWGNLTTAFVLLVTLAPGVLSAPLPPDTQPAKVPRVAYVTLGGVCGYVELTGVAWQL